MLLMYMSKSGVNSDIYGRGLVINSKKATEQMCAIFVYDIFSKLYRQKCSSH